jgi:hypothetical protein
MNNSYSKIFKKTDAFIKSIDDKEVVKVPRIVGRQKSRSNIIMDSLEEYY